MEKDSLISVTITYKELIKKQDFLNKEVRELQKIYYTDPYSERLFNKNITNRLIEVNKHAINALMWKESIYKLSEFEEEFLKICKSHVVVTNDSNDLDDIFENCELFLKIVLFFSLLDQTDYFLEPTPAAYATLSLIEATASGLLPNAQLMQRHFLSMIRLCFEPIQFSEIFNPIINLVSGQFNCYQMYQIDSDPETVNCTLLWNASLFMTYAYGGITIPEVTDYTNLPIGSLPINFQPHYNAAVGLFTLAGMHVWFGINATARHLVVSFSGTELTNPAMISANFMQIGGLSGMYTRAAGILAMILSSFPNYSVTVVGHSLGGGLAQFAVTANIMTSDNLFCYCFNSAGLGNVSLQVLPIANIDLAKERISHFMTVWDPVSCIGGKIGSLYRLPSVAGYNLHSCICVKNCVAEFCIVHNRLESILGEKIVSFHVHSENDFLPDSKQISIISNNEILPIFNTNSKTKSTEFYYIKYVDKLFEQFALTNKVELSALGIVNQQNGTAYTVINRMLLMANYDMIITTQPAGNIQSTLIYGKFGQDLDAFITLQLHMYSDSKAYSVIPCRKLERIFANIFYPFDLEKEAWIEWIHTELNWDLKKVFIIHKNAEKVFETTLLEYLMQREKSYWWMFGQSSSENVSSKEFVSRIASIIENCAKTLLAEAVNNKLITDALSAEYTRKIIEFLKIVVDNIHNTNIS